MQNNVLQDHSDAQCNCETPTADFTAIINNLGVQFLNNSTAATGYNWNFGDGNVSIENNPSHTYGADGSYTVTLEATNGNCSDVHTFEVLVTGIEERVNNNVSLYPNPANDIINVICPNASSLELLSVTGQVIEQINNSNTNEKINVDELSNGVYFVRVVSNNNVTVLKFNKN